MGRNRSLSTWLVLVVVSTILPSTASALTPGPGVAAFTVNSGCMYADPAGFYRLAKTVGEETLYEVVFIADVDGYGTYEAWCEGTATGSPASVPTTGTASVPTCNSGIVATLSSGCAFDIDIWVGSSVEDDDGSGGPVDCSANPDPLLMLGLGNDDKLRGSSHGDAMHGGDGEDLLEGLGHRRDRKSLPHQDAARRGLPVRGLRLVVRPATEGA